MLVSDGDTLFEDLIGCNSDDAVAADDEVDEGKFTLPLCQESKNRAPCILIIIHMMVMMGGGGGGGGVPTRFFYSLPCSFMYPFHIEAKKQYKRMQASF